MLQAAETRPAGGAAIGEVILATGIGLGLTALLLGLVFRHRTRRTTVLTRMGDAIGSRTGVPAWVALPTILTTLSLLTALLGMLWDISLHIGVGRDEGPLANPAHYLILFGLFGVFAGGVLACAMALGEDPGPAAVRFVRGWKVPIGGILVAVAGFYALLGFPLDDVWHRLFGQDVTLWGPTHLMLIGGAGLSIIGLLVLEQEGHGGLSTDDGDRKVGRTARYVRQASAMGGLLLGMSVFQGEYDFDVPQFRLVLEPLMIAGAAGIALVAARLFMGRGGALAATAFFLMIRGLIAVIVGGGFGEVLPTFPLYLGSALLVELLALAVPLTRRPLVFGAVAGVAIGTLGHLTEFGWTRLVQTLSWGSDIAVEGTLMAIAGGVSGGILGALLAVGLRRRLPRPAVARTALVGSLVVLAAAVTNGLVATVPDDLEATFAIEDVQADPRTANISVQLDPAGALDDPSWVQITSWQGDGLVVTPLKLTGEGAYRTTEPVPLYGSWKTMLRLHDGRILTTVPIYLPADEAIPAEEIRAEDGMTRAVVPEVDILQRERKNASGWLWTGANLVVLFCTLALIAAMAWGVGRYSRRASSRAPHPDSAADARRLVPTVQRTGMTARRCRSVRGTGGPSSGPEMPRSAEVLGHSGPSVERTGRTAPRLLLVAPLVVALAGCAGTAAPAATSPAATSPSAGAPAASEPPSAAESAPAAGTPAGQRIEVTVAGGQVSGDTGRVPVAAGEEVTLVVTSDVADEIHVHGYDRTIGISPSRPAQLSFAATVPGVFEVELHEVGTVLLTLQVE